MKPNLQPTLQNDKILLRPLLPEDFEELYLAASDPKIWEQHPNKNRWKREVFSSFFLGALESGGAFKIVNKITKKVIGSTRYYDYNSSDDSILIGYTFYTYESWGKGINQLVKTMMFNYIFDYVSKVLLHVGSENYRSQISISRLGANKIGEEVVAYFGEEPKLNFVYELKKADWL